MEQILDYGYLVMLNEFSDNEGELIFLHNCDTLKQAQTRLYEMGIGTCAYDFIERMSAEKVEMFGFGKLIKRG